MSFENLSDHLLTALGESDFACSFVVIRKSTRRRRIIATQFEHHSSRPASRRGRIHPDQPDDCPHPVAGGALDFSPPLLESSRYSWHRGQLRAEYEAAGEQLRHVSLDGLSRVSELVSQRVTPSVVHINVRQAFDPATWTADRILGVDTFESLKIDGQGSGVIVGATDLL